jgi:hypothetical protein
MTNTTPKANPFDFTDTSNLPEALAKRLSAPTATNNAAAAEWAGVVKEAAKYGLSVVTIAQIEAGATNMGMTVPSTQTVRGYLNKAVDEGLLIKPSRQSYSVAPKAARTKAEEADLSADAVATFEVEENDPLADIG